MNDISEPDWKHPKIQSLLSKSARASIHISIAKDIIESGSDYDPGAIDGEYSEDWHDKLRVIVLEAEQYRKLRKSELTMNTTSDSIDNNVKS